MSSNAAVLSPVGLQRFTPFSRLPPEIRVLIWRLSLSSRVVEIIASGCYAGLYSQAALPTALQVCRESRQSVETLYPLCFGSLLQPGRIRFNFEIDTLYVHFRYYPETLTKIFGIITENELRKLKYFAINILHFWGMLGLACEATEPTLKRALMTMTNLKEMAFVYDRTGLTRADIPTRRPNEVPCQMRLFAQVGIGEAMGDELPWAISSTDVQEKYKDLKVSDAMKIIALDGRRTE
jgi:hypothetical protein